MTIEPSNRRSDCDVEHERQPLAVGADIQITLSTDTQTYLAQASQRNGCWGKFLPIPFEKASKRSWLDPKFDSELLEEQYKSSANPQLRLRFRYALFYVLLISISWFVYYLTLSFKVEMFHWPLICSVLPAVVITIISLILLTHTELYKRFALAMSIFIVAFLCTFSLLVLILLPIASSYSYLSPIGHFSICVEILLLIYTLIPLPLYMCITSGVLYSASFELLSWYCNANVGYDTPTVFVRFLSHVCVQLIGIHIFVMTNVRMRGTFMKVGLSLLVRDELESEKKLKENMIHSLMPPKVAGWLLNDDEHFTKRGMEPRNSNAETNDIQSLFRPFNMNRMENVSILFADIVGFTKMSSKKSAEQLVDILNDLFQRFDHLCVANNCEKISTLGDCYYCVSGCPEPRSDHAKCCVEMGLGMIRAIKQFDDDKNEEVNMRVGVHTGAVLCGIVGRKRFKFDVWSNDVSLANRMESTGKPGTVHVSEKTHDFLQNLYLVEEGEPVFGYKTFFILGKKTERRHRSDNGMFRDVDANVTQRNACNSLQLFVSSPVSTPVSPRSRPRVLSCDTTVTATATHTLAKPIYNSNRLSPDIAKVKASSLPSILDVEEALVEVKQQLDVKLPSSSTSSNKLKLKNWKIPKFLRKSDYKQGVVSVSQISNNSMTGANVGYQPVRTISKLNDTSNRTTKPDIEAGVDDAAAAAAKATSWRQTNNAAGLLHPDNAKDDNIDIKSYISLSRSDVGQYDYSPNEFLCTRTGSYRSHYDKSPKENLSLFLDRAGSNRSHRGRSYSPNTEIVPLERARSATTGGQIERNKNSLEVPTTQLPYLMTEDEISVAQSTNSRKDSGIRSTSRHSSIHQQMFETSSNPPCDMLEHRVSGYYTSSQSTVYSPDYSTRLPTPFCQKTKQNLRKLSDKKLIKCVQDNFKSKSSYFMKPPLSKITLFFENKKMEQAYRTNVHAIHNLTNDAMSTLATSRFNTYLDVFVSAFVFFVISLSLFILYRPTALWTATFVLFVVVQICAFCLCLRKVSLLSDRVFKCCSNWYKWNTFGAVLVSVPVVSVLTNFICIHSIFTTKISHYLYIYLLFVGIIHFCNFTQLNCWMRNVLATCFAFLFLLLNFSNYCANPQLVNVGGTSFYGNYSHVHNISLRDNTTNPYFAKQQQQRNNISQEVWFYDYEIVLDLILLLLLVWFLNREFEISYRLSFHSNYVANRDEIHVQTMKNQADWLIFNIVPEHVAEQLKKNAKYSENFKNVGIIFASIVNFNEMYDESYLGGKEFLRVLNELIGDFDELLTLPQFKSVEKIKTIGSTYMAASGLNPKTRCEHTDPHHHLYALMDFAIAMQNVIDDFNRDLLEFNLILRVGYNFGDVTAAVIGNTKLYYDIWGDAVNIASRMDSTGVNGKIQIGSNCLEILERKYDFEPRGSVYVKGKDNMNVFLLLHKRDLNRDV